jgi:membrane peptidoglycan carboxypeptidase
MKDWAIKHISKTAHHLRPRKEMGKWQKAIRIVAIGAIGAIALGFLITVFYAIWLLFTFNPLDGIPRDSTLILDKNGGLLYTIHGEENRKTLDSLSEVSPKIIDATLAIEDDQFYHHIGIDIPALTKAVLSEFGIGTPRGGSTITQQFVRNSFLTLEHSYTRKYREIMMSLILELKFSKDEILLMYLNEIPYGNNAYGIELAAEKYFGKKAADLTLGESALLASLPNAPTWYSPYGNHLYTTLDFEPTAEYLGNREIVSEADLVSEEFTRGLVGKSYDLPNGTSIYLRGRSDLVLERMITLEMITETEKASALAEIQTMAITPYPETIKAPHFVMWVKSQLEQKYGKEIVEQGGLRVTTTIDPAYQTAAEEAIKEHAEYNSKTYNCNNEALISIDPQNGQILAMVGSADWGNADIDGQVNMITSLRAPGSSFKPFVYALAFLKQYTPATVLYDVPTSFGSDTPKNFDGAFKGPMTIREALGQSRNIPAIKAYFLAGQEKEIVPFVEKFGVTTLNGSGDFYGYPLALGAGEVTPLEFAEAYSVFANGGIRVEPVSILKVEPANGGAPLEEWSESDIKRTEVLDPQVAYLINDILSDSSVNIGQGVYMDSLDNAAKTGTSTDDETGYANNGWIAAYTPTLVTIGWSGNANGDPMNASGEAYYTIAPIWKSYMTKIASTLKKADWARPEGIKDVAISKASGRLPVNGVTPSDMIRTEVFASFAVPTEPDNAYSKVKIETVSGRLATEYSPKDVIEEKVYRIYREDWSNWQASIDQWVANQKEKDPDSFSLPPTEFASDIHNSITAATPPQITIVSPNSLSSAKKEDKFIEVEVSIENEGNGIEEVVFLMNGMVQYHAPLAPYLGKMRIPTSAIDGTILNITAKAVDIYGYSGESSIEVRVSTKTDNGSDDS